MATADDRGAVNSPDELGDAPLARPPNTKRWIWLIVAILLAAFAGVGAVQWQQLQLLNSMVLYDSDNIVWNFYQVEHELTRLQHALADASRDPDHLDREALQLRYDVFVSRLSHIEPERTERHFASAPIQTDMVARLHAFVAYADAYLGPAPAQALDAAALRWLGRRLESMGPPRPGQAQGGNEPGGARASAAPPSSPRPHASSLAEGHRCLPCRPAHGRRETTRALVQ